MKTVPISEVYLDNISYPGVAPIYAVHVRADRLYIFCDPRALSHDKDFVEEFAQRVRLAGEINPDLWEFAEMTESERETYEYGMWMRDQEERIWNPTL